MARAPGGTVHVGKAAAIILVGLVLAVIVLRSDGSGAGVAVSSGTGTGSQVSITTTTVKRSGGTTTTTVALRDPSTVKVIAVNGTKTSGQGAKATTKLQNANYNAIAPGNATAAVRATNPATVIYVVTPGYEREATAVAAVFGLTAASVKALPTPSPSPDIKNGVNIAVLIGSGITL
jgi:hypothetical protein